VDAADSGYDVSESFLRCAIEKEMTVQPVAPDVTPGRLQVVGARWRVVSRR
jgi:hypothetical protein